jgi:D-alanyl-D-alanine carboxypeptidase
MIWKKSPVNVVSFQEVVLAGPPMFAVRKSLSQAAMRRTLIRRWPNMPAPSKISAQTGTAQPAMRPAWVVAWAGVMGHFSWRPEALTQMVVAVPVGEPGFAYTVPVCAVPSGAVQAADTGES